MSFLKSSLIACSSPGEVNTSMAVIASAFPWFNVLGCAAMSPTDNTKVTEQTCDEKQHFININEDIYILLNQVNFSKTAFSELWVSMLALTIATCTKTSGDSAIKNIDTLIYKKQITNRRAGALLLILPCCLHHVTYCCPLYLNQLALVHLFSTLR